MIDPHYIWRSAMGKPSKGTPKDGRLKENGGGKAKPKGKPTTVKR